MGTEDIILDTYSYELTIERGKNVFRQPSNDKKELEELYNRVLDDSIFKKYNVKLSIFDFNVGDIVKSYDSTKDLR